MKRINNRAIDLVLVTSLFLVLFLVFHGVKHSFYLYLIVIGAIFSFLTLRRSKSFNLTFHLLTGFLWGAGLVVVFSGTLSMVGVLIRPWVLILPIVLDIFLIYILPINPEKLTFKFSLEDFLLVGFLLIALASRVISIKGYTAPILHDPVSHATWAKSIFETGRIDYFYSPGLHILAALGMFVDKVNVATYILRLTNIFNAFLFVPVYYFLNKQFKSKTIALLGSASFLITAFPTNFYLIAGKNALVMALPYLPLLLCLLSEEDMNKLHIIWTNSLVFLLVIIHYPVAAISLLVAGCYILFEKRIKNLIYILPGMVLGLIWGVAKFPYRIQEKSTALSPQINVLKLTVEQIGKFLRSSFMQSYMYFQQPYDKYLYYLGLIALLILFMFAFRNKKYRGFVTAFFASVMLAIFINAVPMLLKSVNLIYLTQIITFGGFIYLALAICLGSVLDFLTKQNNLKWLTYSTTIVIMIMVLFINYHAYRAFQENQASKNLISSNDLRAFDWIQDNILPSQIILNNAAQNNRKTIVYGSDGGLWIPVFTSQNVTMPFTEFSDVKTLFFYEEYEKLLQGLGTCSVFDDLLNAGAMYYYKDSSGVYGPQLNPIDYPENLIQIYSQDGVKIFEIQGCN